jgi:translocation and assembly module TamA
MMARQYPGLSFRPAALLLLGFGLSLGIPLASGQETPVAEAEAPAVLPYRVTVVPTGVSELDSLLRAASPLIRLQERAPTDALGLVARINAEPDRLRPAFESEGF